MTYSIRYSPKALQDMEDVRDGVYEASKSIDLAEKYVNEFIKAIEEKKKFPHSGISLVYKGLFTGFYSVNYKKYKAFYRVKEEYVEVIRIIMAKREYMTILFGGSETD